MWNKPAVGADAPVICNLLLTAVLDFLLEHSQLVADGVAGGGNFHRGERIHIAGCKPPETAVSQSRIRLGIQDIRGAAAQILQSALHCILYADIESIFQQASAHQKFHGQIVHLFPIRAWLFCSQNPGHDFPNNHGGSLKYLIISGGAAGYAEMGAELVFNRTSNFIS